MLLAHQQACHSLPVTSIRESPWTRAALPCISAQEQRVLSPLITHPCCEWVALLHTAGRQGMGATQPRRMEENLEMLQNKGVSEATAFNMPGFVIKADSRQYS